jgi:hypothetical protein
MSTQRVIELIELNSDFKNRKQNFFKAQRNEKNFISHKKNQLFNFLPFPFDIVCPPKSVSSACSEYVYRYDNKKCHVRLRTLNRTFTLFILMCAD